MAAPALSASDYDQFKVKRQEVFAFKEKPRLARHGKEIEISFTVEAACDATVAIEDKAGTIVRHLASGVLGDNPPKPFTAKTLTQKLMWDGKNDQGEYVSDRDDLTVRVSLGLSPRFERTLNWQVKMHLTNRLYTTSQAKMPTPLMRCAPEGMYVLDSCGVDHLRLFDHDGNYVRTIYPFPADKLPEVKGLSWHQAAQDGKRVPQKVGFLQATFLASGGSGEEEIFQISEMGSAGNAMAVCGERIALAGMKISRLSTAGSSSGPSLHYPQSLRVTVKAKNWQRDNTMDTGPTSAAFSPDGKYLYLAGYMWRDGVAGRDLVRDCLHGVTRIEFDRDEPPQLFVGSLKQDDFGTDNAHFCDATSVACDSKGRVYVADYMNDRVQVFSPDATYLKSIAADKPARISIDPKSGELYVFSWAITNWTTSGQMKKPLPGTPTLTRFGAFDRPEKIVSWPLPLTDYVGWFEIYNFWGGLEHYVEYDFHAKEPTIWVSCAGAIGANKGYIKIYTLKDGQWALKRDFMQETADSIVETVSPWWGRQRLYANPKTGKLWVATGQTTTGKAFFQPIEIDPETGACKRVELPFDSEDVAFDLQGHVYLRTNQYIVRYAREGDAWREVPFDYGEEGEAVAYGTILAEGRQASVMSGIKLDRVYISTYHQAGMWVNAKGNIAVGCLLSKGDAIPVTPTVSGNDQKVGAAPYVPKLYPGRLRLEDIHVFDKYGKILYADAIPGSFRSHGLAIDADDHLYSMSYDACWLDGKPYDNMRTGTLLKVKPQESRFITSGDSVDLTGRMPIPLPESARPNRPADMWNGLPGRVWLEGVLWKYGGVGFTGKDIGHGASACACWNSRFAFDYFARSFAPEVDHYSIAVLDSNGNLIMRIGQYGNVDDGMPLIKDGGPASPRSIGGDEVAMFYACYLATHTDRRLFIADAGNARVLSVKLGYHAEEKVAISPAK